MGSPPEPQEETMRAGGPRQTIIAALGGLGLALSACTGMLGPEDNRAGLSCVDDSPECVDRRQTTLKAMLADKDRAWVREAPTAQAHASGVRLFAFRSKKAELSCEELAHARKEAEGAPKMLKGSQGLSPAQISRASMFATEVHKELAAEMKKRRCRA
jgi:hypothetical protein